MKKPKWHAKAFYIIFALALIVGLTPVTAMAGHAEIVINGPGYAKEGDSITFEANTEPTADSVTWDMPPEFVTTSGGSPGPTITGYFNADSAPDTYEVHAVGHWGANLVQDAYFDILIGEGLIPQLEYNIIGTEATFCVPTLYETHVVLWRFEPTFYPSGSYSVVSGGQPRDDCVTVHSSSWGEMVIWADTEQFVDGTGATVPATSLMAIKKWGKIFDTWLFGWNDYTEEQIWDSGETQVWWCEDCKEWMGEAHLYDLIIGNFITDGGMEHQVFADGADVEWWLLDANAPVHSLPSGIPAYDYEEPAGVWNPGLVTLIEDMQAQYPAMHVGFNGDCDLKYMETVSGDADIDGLMTGLTGVDLTACGEEAVKIVVVAKYPEIHGSQWLVFPEIISWNFWTQEVEKVPQVRWAGEKIVLEKQFGTSYSGFPVLFALENQSVGTLEPIDPFTANNGVGFDIPTVGSSAFVQTAQSVWSTVDAKGIARAILTSESPGECDAVCAVYDPREAPPFRLTNQHGFVVFFLKAESISLGNMQGQREYHNDGLWDPILVFGETTAATANTLTDDTQNWDDDQYVGKTVRVWKGEREPDGSITFIGDLQIREIESNTRDTLTIAPEDWDIVPEPVTPPVVQWYYEIVDPVWDPTLDDLSQELNVSQDALLRVRVKGWFMGDDLSWRPSKLVDLDGDGFAETMLPAGRWVLPDDWPILGGGILWQEFRPHWDIMTQPNDDIVAPDPLGPYAGAEGVVAEPDVIGPYNSLDSYNEFVQYPPGRKTIVRNGKLNWWDCPMPAAKIVFEVMSGPGFFKEANKAEVYYDWDDNGGLVYTNPFYWIMLPASLSIPAFINNGGYDWDSFDATYGPYPLWAFINQPPGLTPSDAQHPTKVEVYSDNHGEAMAYLNGDWNLDLSDWQLTEKDPPYDAFDVPVGTEVGTTTVMAMMDYPYLRKHPPIASNTVEKTWTWGKEIKGYSVDIGENEKRVYVFVCDRDGFPVYDERIVWTLEGTNGGFIESYLVDTGGHDLDDLSKRGESWTRPPTQAEADAFEAKFGKPCHYGIAGVVVYNSLDAIVDLTVDFYEREGVIVRDVILDYNPGGVDIFWEGAGDPAVLLAAGWNNVAWADVTAPAVADAVEPLGDAFMAIWQYDAFSQKWLAYSAGAPGYANDNFQLKPLSAYWIQVTSAVTWNQGA